ncbi:hypothetical protein MMYC01_202994 [Madurella mycetomatis]|uniref:GH16 domain-containing protein n=1 Tax=Madurella mycetomatis TaxID=100816 RepID=A0A175WDP7_9PEZI|nr:hypothetical protein MMYC01_202994 [Madurella mycetomatis]
MAPSLVCLGTAALVYASGVVAQQKSYQLKESYTPSNFFDKFSFFSDRDPNRGFVQYRNRADAERLHLIETGQSEVKISVDAKGHDQDGRSSVRLESKNTYNSGLFIADFSHFPRAACGAWPAFWMVGPDWPEDGEVDIYEGWNLNEKNKIVLHTDRPLVAGICTIDQGMFTSEVQTSNCWNEAPGQPGNAGCAVDESNGLFGNPNGGVFAMEWQEDRIRVWSWAQGNVPLDVAKGTPEPDSWGTPSFAAFSNTCNIKKGFRDMRMILNINFCGDAAGNKALWGGCAAKTGHDECYTYVQWTPEAYEETFWKVRGINVYELETVQPSSTSTTVSSTSTSTSTTSTSTSTSAVATTTSSSTSASTTTTSTSTLTSATSTFTSASTSATATPPEETTTSATITLPEETTASTMVTLPAEETTTSPTVTLPDDITTATTAAETSTSTASETDTESECSDDDFTTTTAFTSNLPETTGSATTTTEAETETESECYEDETTTLATATSSVSDVASSATEPTATASVPETTSAQEYTTSTIYTTTTLTVSSCAPSVTDCPGRVVTSVIAIGTTVCPVTSTPTAAPTSSINTDEGQWTTSTIYSTSLYTVTSCPPSVTTNCPGHITMTVVPIGTTVCPVTGGEPATTIKTFITLPATTSAEAHKPTASSSPDGGDDDDVDVPEATSSPVPLPSSSAKPPYDGGNHNGTKPELTKGTAVVPPFQVVTTSPSSSGKPPVVVSGGAKVVGSGVMAILGAAVAAFMF